LRVGLAVGLSEKSIDLSLWREFAGFEWWGFHHEKISGGRPPFSENMIGQDKRYSNYDGRPPFSDAVIGLRLYQHRCQYTPR
jgi:hypothetical protein